MVRFTFAALLLFAAFRSNLREREQAISPSIAATIPRRG